MRNPRFRTIKNKPPLCSLILSFLLPYHGTKWHNMHASTLYCNIIRYCKRFSCFILHRLSYHFLYTSPWSYKLTILFLSPISSPKLRGKPGMYPGHVPCLTSQWLSDVLIISWLVIIKSWILAISYTNVGSYDHSCSCFSCKCLLHTLKLCNVMYVKSASDFCSFLIEMHEHNILHIWLSFLRTIGS